MKKIIIIILIFYNSILLTTDNSKISIAYSSSSSSSNSDESSLPTYDEHFNRILERNKKLYDNYSKIIGDRNNKMIETLYNEGKEYLNQPIIQIIIDYFKPVSFEQWKENGKKLIIAATTADTKIIKEAKELLEQDQIDVNFIDENCCTALMHSANEGHKEIVELLLNYKADVNIKTDFNTTALMFAAAKGHIEIVKLLLTHSADVNIKDDLRGATALSYASFNKHNEIIDLLKQKDKS